MDPSDHLATDARLLGNGLPIPSLPGYCDQPYVVRLADGTWLCVMTTGPVSEGLRGQRIVAVRSADRGRTWSAMVDIEAPDGREASWVMPFLTGYGRVYAFYVFNRDDLRSVPIDQGRCWRVDTLGVYAYRWSDDGGLTWSTQRGEIPLREAAIDRLNPFGGDIRFFWGVGRPILHQGRMYFGFARVGGFGHGFMARSEGALVASDNIDQERDPARLRFAVLPEGDTGLQAPNGPRAEETCVAGLADGSLVCTCRGIDGFLMHAYSRDGGRTFTPPAYATYRPGGRRIKHPLACPPLWRLRDGRFLLWYHNHGGRWYEGRNPVWLSAGVERDGVIHWSEPEIALYAHDPAVRMSYPDLIEEEDGSLYLTQTQKTVASVHRVDPALVQGLFRQHDRAAAGPADALVRMRGPGTADWRNARTWHASGMTLVAEVEMPRRAEAAPLLSWAGPRQEVVLAASMHGSFAFSGPGAAHQFARDQAGGPGVHRIALILDARTRLALLVIDGALVDGGSEQQCGWAGLHHCQPDTAADGVVTAHPRCHDAQVFDRAISVSEAVLLTRTGWPSAGLARPTACARVPGHEPERSLRDHRVAP